MVVFKKSLDLFFSNWIINVILIALVVASSVFLSSVTHTYIEDTKLLREAKELYGEGYVYLSNSDAENNLSETFDADIEGLEAIHKTIISVTKINQNSHFVNAYDDDFLQTFEDNLVKGRLPQSGEVFEVLCCEGTYEIGDTIKYNDTDTEVDMVVVGLLSEEMYFLKFSVGGSGSMLINVYTKYEYEDRGYVQLIARTDTMLVSGIITHIDSNICLKFDKSYFAANQEAVLEQLSAYGTAFTFDSVYQTWKDDNIESLKQVLPFFIIILLVVLTLISISTIMLFNGKSKLFSVFYLNGFSISHILRIAILYVLEICSVAVTLTFILLSISVKILSDFQTIHIHWANYLVVFLIPLFMLALSSGIVYFNIKNKSIINNLTENE